MSVSLKGLPQIMRASEVVEATGITMKSVLRAYHGGYLKVRPPRGMSRPILFRREDVVDWLMGEGD